MRNFHAELRHSAKDCSVKTAQLTLGNRAKLERKYYNENATPRVDEVQKLFAGDARRIHFDLTRDVFQYRSRGSVHHLPRPNLTHHICRLKIGFASVQHLPNCLESQFSQFRA